MNKNLNFKSLEISSLAIRNNAAGFANLVVATSREDVFGFTHIHTHTPQLKHSQRQKLERS